VPIDPLSRRNYSEDVIRTENSIGQDRPCVTDDFARDTPRDTKTHGRGLVADTRVSASDAC
jgi:hypothetical protein